MYISLNSEDSLPSDTGVTDTEPSSPTQNSAILRKSLTLPPEALKPTIKSEEESNGNLTPKSKSSPEKSPRSRSMSPRSSNRQSPRRLKRHDVSEERDHFKKEIHLPRELIDFDQIKGSAFFHTKPSKHIGIVVSEGIRRVIFLPFHAPYWCQTQSSWFYRVTTALYTIHLIALAIFFLYPDQRSTVSSFEAFFPIALLLPVAISYGRVSSTLLDDITQTDTVSGLPNLRIVSPTKQNGQSSTTQSGINTSAAPTETKPTATALDPDVEADNSDDTDSDDESGHSTSSSDECEEENVRFDAQAGNTTSTFGENGSPTVRTNRSWSDREHIDNVGRRRVTVCVWEDGAPIKKSLSITELRNAILDKVKATPSRLTYRRFAKVSAVLLAVVPFICRLWILCHKNQCLSTFRQHSSIWTRLSNHAALNTKILVNSFQSVEWNQNVTPGAIYISISCMLTTYYLAFIIFSALADAEVTYHRRFLYAKCFTSLTSARRSRIVNLPHFRLKNVVHIKAWIALRGGRTWLKRQGRQRAADEIVSSSFLVNLVLLVAMGMQAVSDIPMELDIQRLLHVETTAWCLLSSTFMLRFMMLGSRINRKYQNTSLLLTEQMNVYLRLLMKPHKREKLLVSNNVLKLASKLLKELNPPNKVSGLTMNPLLYNITRVVVLSAFSTTASEFFGFKLKLWKMKV